MVVGSEVVVIAMQDDKELVAVWLLLGKLLSEVVWLFMVVAIPFRMVVLLFSEVLQLGEGNNDGRVAQNKLEEVGSEVISFGIV